MGITTDENWNYIELPANIDMKALEALDPTQTLIADWNYCGDDGRYENLEKLLDAMKTKDCKSKIQFQNIKLLIDPRG